MREASRCAPTGCLRRSKRSGARRAMADVRFASRPPSLCLGSPVFTRVVPSVPPLSKGGSESPQLLLLPSSAASGEWCLPPGSAVEMMNQPLPPLVRPHRPCASAMKYYPPGCGSASPSPPQRQKVFTILQPPSQPAEPVLIAPPPPVYTAVQPFYNSPESCRSVELTGAALSGAAHSGKKATPARESVDDDVELCNPPLDDVEKVKGYEDVTFEPMTVPPPADPEESPEPDDRAKQCVPPNIPQLTEEEVREALMQHTVTRCTYVRSVAREMIVSRMDHCPGYQYSLESFTELRQVAWSFEPYTGGIVDDSSEGSAPAPWEIRSYCPSYFQNHVATMEVPHTASVKTCHTCGGIGRRRCSACSATGSENCYYCHGDGHKTSLQGQRERCYYCQGTGRKKCWKCGGDGMAACRSCGGTGQIKCFIALTVTWTNHVEEHVEDEPTEIGERMESATGHIVMEEERHKVFPIENFPEGRMADVSAKLLEKHRLAFSNEKLLMQRHRVRMIPVAAVSYHWQSHIGCYYVYGLEKKVYAPDYPQACCCAIL